MCMSRGFVNDGSFGADRTYQRDRRRRFLVADHIKPHRGDEALFWTGELQTLCADDHDVTKQQIEVRGYHAEPDADGWPIDPNHPANRSAA